MNPTTGQPLALDENGNPVVVCEACGSRNLELDGWDIDKCQDCGRWRYRGQGAEGEKSA